MEKALDQQTADKLTAIGFEALPADAQAESLPRLTCPSCGARAYFRRRSRDGRAPCFFALDHDARCDYASSSRSSRQRGRARDVEIALVEAESLKLRFGRNPTSSSSTSPASTSTTGRQRTRTTSSGQGSAQRSKQPRTGLGELLDYLIEDPEFADSHTKIETEDGYTWRAANLLVPFTEADPHENPWRPHVFWGPLTGASWDLKFVHTGGADDTRIFIGALRQSVLEAECIEHPADLAGAWAIAFGWACQTPPAPPYIQIHRERGEKIPRPENIALRVE